MSSQPSSYISVKCTDSSVCGSKLYTSSLVYGRIGASNFTSLFRMLYSTEVEELFNLFFELKDKVNKARENWKKKEENKEASVNAEDIANVVSAWTKIPVTKLTKTESEKLKNLDLELKKRVIGQDDAVEALARAIKRARVGLQNENRPIGSFMFLGPTGVGKTELTKALAENLFGNENQTIDNGLIQISDIVENIEFKDNMYFSVEYFINMFKAMSINEEYKIKVFPDKIVFCGRNDVTSKVGIVVGSTV